jgi:hypothetical protein
LFGFVCVDTVLSQQLLADDRNLTCKTVQLTRLSYQLSKACLVAIEDERYDSDHRILNIWDSQNIELEPVFGGLHGDGVSSGVVNGNSHR